MSTRRLIATAGALAVAFTAAPVTLLHSQVPVRKDSINNPWPGAGTGPTSRADSSFIREAIAGNLLEVQLGNLAERKAANAGVKQFAQQMVTDHTRMAGQWNAIARSMGLPTVALDQTQLQEVTRLGQLSGAEFDREYMTSMIQDHQRDADTFRSLGPTAQTPLVRQLAASGLTTIQQHLQMAQQVGSTVGANTNVAVAPQGPQPRVTSQNARVAPQPARGGSSDVRADRQFIHQVVADYTMEIRLGQMAQRRATGSDPKQLADRMVSDVTRWQDRWTSMASRNGIQLELAMGDQNRDKLERVQKASKDQFDRIYVRTVIENLQSMVSDFQNEGRSARSSEVRNLVQDEIPRLKEHLEIAKRARS